MRGRLAIDFQFQGQAGEAEVVVGIAFHGQEAVGRQVDFRLRPGQLHPRSEVIFHLDGVRHRIGVGFVLVGGKPDAISATFVEGQLEAQSLGIVVQLSANAFLVLDQLQPAFFHGAVGPRQDGHGRAAHALKVGVLGGLIGLAKVRPKMIVDVEIGQQRG